MGVRLESGGHEAVLIVDSGVHPALLDRPERSYVSDLDHDRCVETRRALLDELVDADVLVVCGHYPGSGVGWIRQRGHRVVWEHM
jgi:glyoxylase-like metal-dependent hydrolase (beta-lactamase superfamily II)